MNTQSMHEQFVASSLIKGRFLNYGSNGGLHECNQERFVSDQDVHQILRSHEVGAIQDVGKLRLEEGVLMFDKLREAKEDVLIFIGLAAMWIGEQIRKVKD